jgi:hypothetical protein
MLVVGFDANNIVKLVTQTNQEYYVIGTAVNEN